jgi:predicted MFS family arabinose efflux permease
LHEPVEIQTPPPDLSPPPVGWSVLRRTAAALAYRDFRVLWFGAFASTIGTWVQKVAQSWLVFTLTGSAFFLGLDAFLGELPILLLTLIGGVIADRHDRRRLLIGSQYVQMVCAFTLAALVYWDAVRVWHILALSFLAGCGQAFGGPAHQSLIPSLVPKQDLPNAIALNSIQFNLARAIGPAIAGVVLAALGIAACFGLNGLSFLIVIAALMSLRVRHTPPAVRHSMLHELRGGLSYVRARPVLLSLTMLAFAGAFFGLPMMTLLPVFAREVHGVGAEGYSLMMTWSGAGAVAGALVIAWLGRFRQMGPALLLLLLAFAALGVAFAASPLLWASHLLLFAVNAARVMTFSLNMSLMQLTAPDEMRGRVMSIYMVAFRGGLPLGSLAAGYAATLAPAPVTLMVMGGTLAVVSIYFLLARQGVREL